MTNFTDLLDEYLEAKEGVISAKTRHPSYRHFNLREREEKARDALNEYMKMSYLPPVAPIKYGCHCDLDPHMEPDGCVLDDGSPDSCVYAKKLLEEGKDRNACHEWKPISFHSNSAQPAAPNTQEKGDGDG